MQDETLFDRALLDAQTGGDAALAHDLLVLFEAQCRRIRAGLADGSAPAGLRADLLHTLRGSALGVGAARLAACTQEAERRLRANETAGEPVETVDACIRATLDAIARGS